MMTVITPLTHRSLTLRIAVSIGIFLIALAARFVLLPVNANAAFATFYPATVLTFYLCGTGPGLLTVGLSAFAGFHIFTTPAWSWAFHWRGVVSVSAYLISSLLIAWIVYKLQAVSKEREVALGRLGETSKDLQDLYNHAPCGYHSLDAQGRFLRVNDTELSWLGCSRNEVLSGTLSVTEFFSDEGKRIFAENFPRLVAEGHIGPIELDLIGRDGQRRRIAISATPVHDGTGRFLKSRSVMYDITELDRAKQELQRLNRAQLAMLDNELIAIVKVRNRRAVWKNRALDRMFGYAPGELDNQPARLLYRDDESYRLLGEAAYPVLARGENFRTQLVMSRKGGEPIWVDMSGVLLSKETDESMWFMLDITPMKRQQEQVEQIAFHDPLTGLANRLLLSDRLNQAILLQARLHSLLAVCFIDLNGFKAVNDSFGHDAGDAVLQVIASRLRQTVRGTDTVARFGGDEFVIALTPLQSRDECHAILRRVEKAIAEPIVLTEQRIVRISASLGIAFCPEDGATPEALLAHADRAMYNAKRATSAA